MSDAVKKAPAQKAWRMPHTYVIIFFVVLVGWILTLLIPVGLFDTHKVSYKDANGKDKTKTVLIPESFRYAYKAFDLPALKGKLTALAADDAALQALALEMNLSETAFPRRRPDGQWDLRWFTPATEVDLCGHATLATAHALFQLGLAGLKMPFGLRDEIEHRIGGDDRNGLRCEGRNR